MQGSGFLEILVLAMIAGFLVLRLRSVLGRRTGNEPRGDRFRGETRESDDSNDTVIQLPDRGDDKEQSGADDDVQPPPPPRPEAGPPSGLTQIKISDPGFNENEFLEGGRVAFEMILDAFAAGDKKRLKSLLAGPVYDGFASEIDRREQAGERLETTLVSFVLADIVGATVEGRKAWLTVKFLTEQVNVLRNAADEVIDGDPSSVEKINDVWIFGRDLKSRDPNWQLVETSSED
ncbi:MAG: Tim44/TimA family putative adaptor protein [Alphaproteobacteria bacterium]